MTVLNLNHFGMDQLFVKLFQDNKGVLYGNEKKTQTSMFEVGTPNDTLALVPAHPIMAGPFTIFPT